MKSKYIKLAIFILAVIIIVIVNNHYKLHERIHNFDDFKYMIGDNIVKASVIYIIVTAVGSSVLALPGITFALFSGILFGPVLGIILFVTGYMFINIWHRKYKLSEEIMRGHTAAGILVFGIFVGLALAISGAVH